MSSEPILEPISESILKELLTGTYSEILKIKEKLLSDDEVYFDLETSNDTDNMI